MTEKYEFIAEIDQLMDLIIHAFYSKKEVFLRELVSNASDALNKLKYNVLSKNLDNNVGNLEIKITPDLEKKTLTISDNGIGMSKDDLVNLLGSLAKSGTKEFIKLMKENKHDDSMIGKFGVGFYSAYLVASKVDVYTKHWEGDKVFKWSSDAKHGYTVEEVDYELERGTDIVLHMREEDEKFLQETKLRTIIKTHSNFVPQPIFLLSKKTREVEKVKNEEEEDVEENLEENDNKEGEVEEQKEDEKTNEVEKETEEYFEYEQVNSKKCIWMRNPKEVSKEEYQEFYESISGSKDSYRDVLHFRVEGAKEYSFLLYIPQDQPADMFADNDRLKGNIKLYSRQVFITDNCNEIIPRWLRFFKGVIDSNDIQLNVSREMIQNSEYLKSMNKFITKKTIKLFTQIAEEDEEKYLDFYNSFSKSIKFGIYEDDSNRKNLVSLLRCYTLNHTDKPVSLKTYKNEMKEKQKSIYYIAGDNLDEVSKYPLIDEFKDRNIDVLFLVDNIDEYVIQTINKFEELEFEAITKEGLDLDNLEEKDKKKEEEKEKQYEDFLNFVKETLGHKVVNVITSKLKTKYPCSVVSPKFGLTANMEKIVKSQAVMDDNPMMQFVLGKRVFELNMEHGLIQKLHKQYKNKENEKEIKNIINMLFETSTLTSGYTLDNPYDLAKRIYSVVEGGLDSGLFSDDELKVDKNKSIEEENLEAEIMDDVKKYKAVKAYSEIQNRPKPVEESLEDLSDDEEDNDDNDDNENTNIETNNLTN